ncbi:MAG: hypothetical protein QW051_03575 [Candidatus Aenigmatarchaeota archaeon]
MADTVNLALIVGTNPLPVYISFKAFYKVFERYEKTLDKVFLICSRENDFQQGTEKIAMRISEKIAEDTNNLIKPVIIPISDVSKKEIIEKEIKKEFLDVSKKSPGCYLHLDYTGGTKALSVHIYRALQSVFDDKFSASYIDARKHSFVFEGSNEIVNYIQNKHSYLMSDNLRKKIVVDIRGLLKLHGYEEKKGGNNSEERYKTIYNAIIKYVKPNEELELEKLKKYKQWVHKVADSLRISKDILKDKEVPTQKDNSQSSSQTIWKNVCEQLPDLEKLNFRDLEDLEFVIRVVALKKLMNEFDEESKDVIEELKKKKEFENFFDSSKSMNIGSLSKNKIEKMLNFVKFFEGRWFELYLYEEMKTLFEKEIEDGLIYIGKNLESVKTDGGGINKRNLELDLYLIYGYQLFAISVTTDDNTGRCKSKAFEVLHRANQIGGEEARAILVTFLEGDRKTDLENDVQIFTGSSHQKIKIFGLDDLPRIGEEIKSFIQG